MAEEDKEFLPAPALERPRRWARMQWSCVEVLMGAPGDVVGAILNQDSVGLVKDPRVGPAAAVRLAENAGGFDVASYLRRFFTRHENSRARRNGVLAARMAGSGTASDVLLAVMTGELEYGARGRRRGRRTEEAQRRRQEQQRRLQAWQRAGLEERRIKIPPYAARALGSMGAASALLNSYGSGRGGGGKAATGLAYLPTDADPVGRIRSLRSRVDRAGALKTLSQAVSTAVDVAAARSQPK